MYSLDLFTIDAYTGTLSADMSDLGLKPGEIPTSFVVPSHEGEEMTFNFYQAIRRDGDLFCVLYVSDYVFGKFQAKAKLFND